MRGTRRASGADAHGCRCGDRRGGRCRLLCRAPRQSSKRASCSDSSRRAAPGRVITFPATDASAVAARQARHALDCGCGSGRALLLASLPGTWPTSSPQSMECFPNAGGTPAGRCDTPGRFDHASPRRSSSACWKLRSKEPSGALAASPRRSDAARLGGCGAVVPPLIFRKGLDLKHEVASVLAESYHSDLIEAIKTADFQYASGRDHHPSRTRVRLLLRRRSRGRLCIPGAPAFSRTALSI